MIKYYSQKIFKTIFVLLLIILGSSVGQTEISPYLIEGDDISYNYEQGLIKALGQVTFQIDDLVIETEKLKIDLRKNLIEASGEKLKLTTAKQEIIGEFLSFYYNDNKLSIYGAKSKIDELYFQGGVINIYQQRDYQIEIIEASFTPCKLDKPHYQFKAQKIEVYPDKRVVGKEVALYIGEYRLFVLPLYVLKYQKTDTGYQLYNPIPLPYIGYSRQEGFKVNFLYPYQISDNLQGEVIADIHQKGKKQVGINNEYSLADNIKLLSELKLTEKSFKDYAWYKSLGFTYDFKQDYSLNFVYDTEHYQGYLTLESPSYQFLTGELLFRNSWGQVRENKQNLFKLNSALFLTNDFQLTDELGLSLKNSLSNHFYKKEQFDAYHILNLQLKKDYLKELNPKVSLGTSLAYRRQDTRGNPVLKADRVKQYQLIDLQLDLIYRQEIVSWQINSYSSYHLANNNFQEMGIRVIRQLDCYSLAFDYSILDNSFAFSISF